MPITRNSDNEGSYFQYGKHGKKYYFDSKNESSRKRAWKKVKAQADAIKASGYIEE